MRNGDAVVEVAIMDGSFATLGVSLANACDLRICWVLRRSFGISNGSSMDENKMEINLLGIVYDHSKTSFMCVCVCMNIKP